MIQGSEAVLAPMRATVVTVHVAAGDTVHPGQALAVLEAMKMEHVVTAERGGLVHEVHVGPGSVVDTDQPLLDVRVDAGLAHRADETPERDPDAARADLDELRAALAPTLDENRPAAVAKRHDRGLRTARENVADLCDDGSFLEYGQLIVAGQRRVRGLDDLAVNTPADGLVAGIGSVGGVRTAVLAYDYTVLAGTQGLFNHKKTDRLLGVAHEQDLPVVVYTEGGGGRPGDTDFLDASFSALDLDTFAMFGGLTAPRVAVNSGWCFAGNALLFGCADLRIATRDSSIGLAGPVMIEAGGLGACRPEEVGPAEMHAAHGVVDLLAADEAEATDLARRALGYLTGTVPAEWTARDQRLLRHVVPEDRKRVYAVRAAIELIADTGSVLELRREYAPGLVTALVRVEGHPWGLLANDPRHLGGAIDAGAAAKAADFLGFCERFGLPVVSLCDTPGFMVGPDSERQATAGAAARMVNAGSSLTVPLVMVCLRKGYGIGAMAMGGGSFRRPLATVAWPSGEFGAMGLEGAARIVSRAELAALPDDAARQALLDERVEALYQLGKAVSVARFLEIDAVIDPADTRAWLTRSLAGRPPRPATSPELRTRRG
ncbi:MAG TPA: carboxyl transferase domain-containing protein [Mycobacteriales bacterium]|nr:carboxyl transferase domain-containing protein [Mycobacteriales bacterium]